MKQRDPYRLVPDEDEMAEMDRELGRFMISFICIALGIGIPLGLFVSAMMKP